MKVKRAYKQAIVNTDKHNIFKKGQVVEIISEINDFYYVQCTVSGMPESISKKDVVSN